MSKFQTDKCIKPYSTSTEKVRTINLTIIYGIQASLIEHFQCLLRFHRYMQMPRQSIPRSAGNNSQCGISMYQRTSYFINCSVPPDSHNDVSFLFRSFGSYLYCMTGSFRIHYFPSVSRLINFFIQQVKNQFFTLCSRNRIDDEFYFFHSFVHAILVDCRRQK